MTSTSTTRFEISRTSQRMIRRLLVVLGILLVVGALGCDKDNGTDGREILGGDTGGTNNQSDAGDTDESGDAEMDTGSEPEDAEDDTGTSQEDAGDTQEQSDTGTSGDTFEGIDTNRGDGGPDVSGTCENIEDLGVLGVGAHSVSFSFDTSNDYLRTSCRDLDADTKPEKIYQFEVEEGSVLEMEGSPNYTFEVRTSPCGEEESVETCNPNGELVGLNLATGTTYYLIVEYEGAINNTADFPLEIGIESVFTECGPGQTECIDDSTVKVCDDLGSFQQKTCPTSCGDGECAGDSCASPIQVRGGSASFSGDITAFSSKIRAYLTCGQSSTPTLGAAGQEVVFFAGQVQAGQTIDIDASGDSIANTIVLQRGACGSSSACVATKVEGDEMLSHTVQQSGDYFIIIDAASTAAGSANYSVSVN